MDTIFSGVTVFPFTTLSTFSSSLLGFPSSVISFLVIILRDCAAYPGGINVSKTPGLSLVHSLFSGINNHSFHVDHLTKTPTAALWCPVFHSLAVTPPPPWLRITIYLFFPPPSIPFLGPSLCFPSQFFFLTCSLDSSLWPQHPNTHIFLFSVHSFYESPPNLVGVPRILKSLKSFTFSLRQLSHLCLFLKNFFPALTSDTQHLIIWLLPQTPWKMLPPSSRVISQGSSPKTFSLYFLIPCLSASPLWFLQHTVAQTNSPSPPFPCLTSSFCVHSLSFTPGVTSISSILALEGGLSGKTAGTSAKNGLGSCGMLKLDLDLWSHSREDMVGGWHFQMV